MTPADVQSDRIDCLIITREKSLNVVVDGMDITLHLPAVLYNHAH